MPTAVSSSSPISVITPGTVASATAAASASPVAGAEAPAEASDFNTVLSPMLNAAEAGATVAGTASLLLETTPAATDAAVVPPISELPEGLDLTAVLQQSTAVKGNVLPVDGKALPASEVGEDPIDDASLQITVANGTGDGELLLQNPDVQKPDAQLAKHEGAEPDGELLASLTLPTTVDPVITATTASGESVATDTPAETASAAETTAPGEVSAAIIDAQAAQHLQLSVMPETTTAPVATESGNKANAAGDSNVDAQMTATLLPSNSRSVAQHAEATQSAAIPALHSSDAGGDASAVESAVSDLLPVPAGSGKENDVIKSAGFGRLLEAQVSANTNTQQPAADTAALSNRSLNGAVAYRMEGNTQVATTLVNQPVDSPQWSNEIGERVVWFGANKVQHAEIELDPPELGPMQVRISTQNDQTTVTFTSHHAAVREVLDQNLPKLKEMLAEQGLNLVQADVGERRGSQQQQPSDTGDAVGASNDGAAGDDEVDGSAAAKPSTAKTRLSLVDAYA